MAAWRLRSFRFWSHFATQGEYEEAEGNGQSRSRGRRSRRSRPDRTRGRHLCDMLGPSVVSLRSHIRGQLHGQLERPCLMGGGKALGSNPCLKRAVNIQSTHFGNLCAPDGVGSTPRWTQWGRERHPWRPPALRVPVAPTPWAWVPRPPPGAYVQHTFNIHSTRIQHTFNTHSTYIQHTDNTPQILRNT